MSDWQDHLSRSELGLAKEALIKEIKLAPKNATIRSKFIELLCIMGEFERADEQLMQSIKLFPEYLPGASQIRHLVKAAQARKDFFAGAASAQFIEGTEKLGETIVQFILAQKENNHEELISVCERAEQSRQALQFEINGVRYEDVRDLDDRLGGFIELFSSAGNYFLVPMDHIHYLELKPATNMLETLWRPCEFDIQGLGEGEAHFPMTYVDSESGNQKLGRETDWKNVLGTDHCIGQGQKMWLVGDNALALSQLERVALAVETTIE
ncbi:type VI secretion system accessory protein TagJ [Vibrio vulnificus]|uniref:type VI secretion system accessory protein TagJ n=1 Tax=Vibrio vulnificus TaxID=672 RepID=UPI0032F012EC